MKSYVYCITNDFLKKQNLFKIGFTTDLKRRKNDFDTNVLNFMGDFEYVAFNEYSSKEEGLYMESQLHKLLQHYRIKDNKEWFLLENKDLIRVAFNLKSNYKIKINESNINPVAGKKSIIENNVLNLSKRGYSIRKIAKKLSLSKSKVGRIVKNDKCKSENVR